MSHPKQSATNRRTDLIAGICFVISGVAFMFCGLEVVVDDALLDSPGVDIAAATGLLALALGLLCCGRRPASAVISVVVTTTAPESLTAGDRNYASGTPHIPANDQDRASFPGD